ncbi:MAG: aldo/keto reductase [Bryobacteraceae bacterium]
MKNNASRRSFLTAGLGLPAAGLGAVSALNRPAGSAPAASLAAAPEVRFRTLGKTGMKVSSVAFGCMITSDASVIEKAAELGINLFDTARGYQGGNNERMVGAALKKARNNVFISTKTHAPTKEAALEDLNTSLRELGTDHVDVWYLHAKEKADQLTDDLIAAQQEAKKAGKTRFVGVSVHRGHGEVIPAMIKSGQFDVLLTSYNFTMKPSVEPLIESAAKAGLGIVAMKVMAGGYRRIKPGDKHYDTFKREGAHAAMLKWVLRNQNIHTTIPSMTDMDQLDDNLRAMTGAFTPSDEKILAAQLEKIQPYYCRMCGECDGTCEKGLPVSEIVRYVTYADGYGQYALGREHFLSLPAEAAAIRCDLCPTCSVNCKHGVNVAGQISRARELFA